MAGRHWIMTRPSFDLAAHCAAWMATYCKEQKRKGFVIGVSGGVDSAVASTLAAMTGLPTMCITMPIEQARPEIQRARAHLAWLARKFPNVEIHEMDLGQEFDGLARTFRAHVPRGRVQLALVNTKSRLRLAAMYFCATTLDRLVVGTGNKVEHSGVGFFAKYGDGGMDLCPLQDLRKSEVVALGRKLGISRAILRAAPTDGLWPDGRTDEDQIGASYPELEWAMDLRENEVDSRGLKLTARQREVLRIYDKRHADNQHKIAAPPACPLPQGISWPS
ncbi:MAG TPA: NAD(+) synthase [Flavobacteriales bacterium]|nr:NAD(+) synthase [Flavobacteriales bacterium]